MASDDSQLAGGVSRELIALTKTLVAAEREREARLEAKLAQLDAHMKEAERVQKLITGGASHREARLRALEDTVEAMAAERSRAIAPPPLDIRGPSRIDTSVLDMRTAEPTDPD